MDSRHDEMKGYGQELILDMHKCDASLFRRKPIRNYFERLCALIEVEVADFHFWDDFRVPQEERQTNPKTKGTTAVQFLLTSNITIHTLDILKSVYVNIFSCEEFDAKKATDFTVSFFRAGNHTRRVLDRI